MTAHSDEPLANSRFSLGFIGGGHMASAIIDGLLGDNVPAASITVSDPGDEQRKTLTQRFPGIRVTDDNATVFTHCDAVVMAVKPQAMREVCTALRRSTESPMPVVISIAAGIGTDAIAQWLGGDTAVVRAMPNQGAALRLSSTGLFANRFCDEQQKRIADRVMSAVGSALWLDEEKDIDAVTALAGSGPAYVYYLLEAMQQAGEALALPTAVARQLATETAQAAAAIALSDPDSLAALRARVTSPGGTTAAAVDYLQHKDFGGIVNAAIHKAHARAAQLADDAAKD